MDGASLQLGHFDTFGALLPFVKDLNPKGMQNNRPKSIITAIQAIILHIFGVQGGTFLSCFWGRRSVTQGASSEVKIAGLQECRVLRPCLGDTLN